MQAATDPWRNSPLGGPALHEISQRAHVGVASAHRWRITTAVSSTRSTKIGSDGTFPPGAVVGSTSDPLPLVPAASFRVPKPEPRCNKHLTR